MVFGRRRHVAPRLGHTSSAVSILLRRNGTNVAEAITEPMERILWAISATCGIPVRANLRQDQVQRYTLGMDRKRILSALVFFLATAASTALRAQTSPQAAP